jgi:LysM repeat protein
MQNKKFLTLLAFATSLFCKFSQAQSPTDILAYISRYKDLAITEMKRTGIPAAITLAQGIHETEAGTSELVKKSNNHFGIKCKDDWAGETVRHDDDARGECFRKYGAPEESFRDHSDFLRTRPNYASLFTLDPTDYTAWAYGLKKAGYATNPRYAQILIKLIEDYHLEDYTLIALGKMEGNNDVAVNKQQEKDVVTVSNKQTANQVAVVAKENNYPPGEFKINDTRVIFVKQGTAYLAVAQQYEIPLARLFEFNDLQKQEIAAYDQLVFIQRKRKTGEHEFHIVQPGETVNSIAQAEAIRLESLLEYNNLTADMQPAVGETLSLHSRSSATPRLAEKHSIVENSNNNSFVSVNDTKIQQKNFITHTVLPKETVYSIAKMYNVSASDVMTWNQIQNKDVKVGQSLKIYR